MHYHSTSCHHSSCCHSSPHYHGHGCAGGIPILHPVYVPYPTWTPPPVAGWGGHSTPLVVPQELSVDSAVGVKEVLIGGMGDMSVNLEFAPDAGATAPSVKVTVESGGTTSTWQESPITAGYHAKPHLLSVKAGDTVTVEVVEAIARLRWCETVCC